MKLPRYRGATAMLPTVILPIAAIAVLAALSCDQVGLYENPQACMVTMEDSGISATSTVTFVFSSGMPTDISGATARVYAPNGLETEVDLEETDGNLSATVRGLKGETLSSTITFTRENGETVEFNSIVQPLKEDHSVFRDLEPGPDTQFLYP